MKKFSLRPFVFSSVLLSPFGLPLTGGCSSNTAASTPDSGTADAAFGVAPTPTCASPGGSATGDPDTHCDGLPPQPISLASCMVLPDAAVGGDTSPPDAGPPLPCGEDGSSYGSTMYGTSGDDDDCKYHVSYSVGGICENEGVYFVVTVSQLANQMPLTGADPLIEVCLNDTHPSPAVDAPPRAGMQVAREDAANPGTYTIGPIQFDAPGKWTVRFHFFETCFDTLDDSPHGHAAFFMDVP